MTEDDTSMCANVAFAKCLPLRFSPERSRKMWRPPNPIPNMLAQPKRTGVVILPANPVREEPDAPTLPIQTTLNGKPSTSQVTKGFDAVTAQRVLDEFEPEPFYPFLSPNSHVQTVLSNFHPPSPAEQLSFRTTVLPTDDGLDDIHVDIVNGTCLGVEPNISKPQYSSADEKFSTSSTQIGSTNHAVLVVHGLEANSRSRLSARMAEAAVESKFKVVLMNFRSCAQTAPLPKSFKLYHAGFYDDVDTVLKAMRGQQIYVVGYSLGSSVMLNLLGRLRERAIDEYGIVATAGFSVPFDPTSCQVKIDSGLSRMVYASRFASSMTKKVQEMVDAGMEVPPSVSYDRLMNAKTIGEIDDEYVSKVFGFKDRYDYYQKVDGRQYVSSVAPPTFLLTARDDPFFAHDDGSSLPTSEMIDSAPVMIHLTDHGGHCGKLLRIQK